MQNKAQYSREEDNKNTDSDSNGKAPSRVEVLRTNVHSINDLQEKEEEEQQLYKQFYDYLSNKDIKNARKMLRKYNIFNKLKSRDLNEKYDLDNYKFTKHNGVLTLYKPINKQEQQHFEEIERDIHNIEEQENIAKLEYKIEQIEKIAYKIEELEFINLMH